MSRATPLLARVYPNGSGDVNQFQAAGGLAFLTRELLEAGLLHDDVLTVGRPRSCAAYTIEPFLKDGQLAVEAGGGQ